MLSVTVAVHFLAQWVCMESVRAAFYSFLTEKCSNFVVREEQPNKVRVEVPVLAADGTQLMLSQIFTYLEGSYKELGLENYSLSQTSLEQIFNSFAAKQTEETL